MGKTKNVSPESRGPEETAPLGGTLEKADLNRILSLKKRVLDQIFKIYVGIPDSTQLLEKFTDDVFSSPEAFFTAIWNDPKYSPEEEKFYLRLKADVEELAGAGIGFADIFKDFSPEYSKRYLKSAYEMRRLMIREKDIHKLYSQEKEEADKRRKEALKSADPLQQIALKNRLGIMKVKVPWAKISEELEASPADLDVRRQKLQSEIEERVDENNFDWLTFNSYYLRDLITSLRQSGNLVITPKVQDYLDEIERAPKEKPVFLKGDLGCGKTEMALHFGRLNNRKNLDSIREAYFKENIPLISEEDIKRKFEELKDEEKKEYAEKFLHTAGGQKFMKSYNLKETDALEFLLSMKANYLFLFFRNDFCTRNKVLSEELAIEPIILSGHKEFDPAQFVGGFEIITPDAITPEEAMKLYKEARDEFMAGTGLSDEEKKLLMTKSLDFQNNRGIQTRAYLGKLFQAMKYGKVLVVDEVNAMPHEILIILNHYLTRKPGNTIHPPINNLPPFKVKEGYRIILTGNVPKEGQTGYSGRQQLDAAFRNRLHEVPVDYLPNATMDEFKLPFEWQQKVDSGRPYDDVKKEYLQTLSNEERKILRRGGEIQVDKEKVKFFGYTNNELYQVLAVFGLEQGIVTQLPQDYFEKLYRLSMASKVIQDAFSGNEIDARFYGGDTRGRFVLKRAVPSMRDLTTIIGEWRDADFRLSLDHYLWKYFIQKFSDDKKEQDFVFNVYKFYGFFGNEKVFPKEDPSKLNFIGTFKYPKLSPKLKTFGQEEVLTNLFGIGPMLTKEEADVIAESMPEKSDFESEKLKALEEAEEQIAMLEAELLRVADEVLERYCPTES